MDLLSQVILLYRSGIADGATPDGRNLPDPQHQISINRAHLEEQFILACIYKSIDEPEEASELALTAPKSADEHCGTFHSNSLDMVVCLARYTLTRALCILLGMRLAPGVTGKEPG